MAKKRFIFRARGRVTNVSFRHEAVEKARALNLSGFIENKADGSVYAEAEGSPEALEKFLTWFRKGPRHAMVDEVSIEEISTVGHNLFSIRITSS